MDFNFDLVALQQKLSKVNIWKYLGPNTFWTSNFGNGMVHSYSSK